MQLPSAVRANSVEWNRPVNATEAVRTIYKFSIKHPSVGSSRLWKWWAFDYKIPCCTVKTVCESNNAVLAHSSRIQANVIHFSGLRSLKTNSQNTQGNSLIRSSQLWIVQWGMQRKQCRQISTLRRKWMSRAKWTFWISVRILAHTNCPCPFS